MIFQVNNGHLYYEKSGAGRPLILLHGNGEMHKIFDKAIPILAENFTVYAIDSRGHGQSQPVLEYHYADMAEDIKCFIEALELKNPMLYGFSDGGAELLHKIQVPTKVLAGSRDMIKQSHTEYIAKNIKDSPIDILQGEGHGSYIVHSTKIAKLILDVQ